MATFSSSNSSVVKSYTAPKQSIQPKVGTPAFTQSNSSIQPKNPVLQSKVPTSSIKSSIASGGSSSGTTNINLQSPSQFQTKAPTATVFPKSSTFTPSYGTYTPTIDINKTIAVSDITSPYIEYQQPQVDQTDYTSLLANLSTKNPDGTDKIPEQPKNALQQYMEEFSKINPPDTGDIYNKSLNDSGLTSARQQVSDLTSQLNAITSRAQAQQIALTGQGRGIPEAIIGGQQAEIAREAAIEALPVSAQLQAAQGNLQMAQENMNTLFKIRSDQAERAYNNRISVLKVAYEYATEQEKRKLDAAAKKEEREYQKSLKVEGYTKDYMDIIKDMIKDGDRKSTRLNSSH